MDGVYVVATNIPHLLFQALRAFFWPFEMGVPIRRDG